MGKLHLFTLPEGLRESTVGLLDLRGVTDLAAEELQCRRARFNLDVAGNVGVTDRVFNPDAPDPFPCTIFDLDELPYHLIGNRVPYHWSCSDPNCHDRYFRNAVEYDGQTISVNMSKARILHMDRIRKVRDIELEKLSGSKYRQPTEIEAFFSPDRQAQLQALRDIPQTLDLGTYATPEALKAAWPPGLPRP